MIQLSNVKKWYGDFQVLNDINLSVQEGEKVVICGPSGSGKSTLIRCLNALEDFQEGKIQVNGFELGNELKTVESLRQQVGMVFQHFNLFPHLTILENLTLAPVQVLKMDEAKAKELALKFLRKVRIEGEANKYPSQLSGGQKQRVAIARSLCMQPKVMLFDEPTSALDPEMVKEVLEVMIDLAKEGMTMLCVTHEMGFAQQVADRIVFMDEGKIVDDTNPQEFFSGASSDRAQEFLKMIL